MKYNPNPKCKCGHNKMEHIVIGLLIGGCKKCNCRGFMRDVWKLKSKNEVKDDK